MNARGWGALDLSVTAPGPTPTMVTVHDTDGRVVVQRRLRTRRTRLLVPAGRLRVVVDDDRLLSDPRRHTTAVLDVDVAPEGTVPVTAELTPGSVVRASLLLDDAPARFARVCAEHGDGTRLDLRADGLGVLVLAGLRTGTWTLTASDARRRCALEPVRVEIAAGSEQALDLPLVHGTAAVLVQLTGSGRRPVETDAVTLVHLATGTRVRATVRGQRVLVRGLLPGAHRLTVAPSLGHLGTSVVVPTLAADALVMLDVDVRVGALLTGRVAQGDVALGAVVRLLDADGRELERTRTDRAGRYELGIGLDTGVGLTVEAGSGPQTLHATRAAMADVAAVAGIRHDLGVLALPVTGADAEWAPRSLAVHTLRLPSTRL